ncbi:hypothetical protein Egran_04354 [Elaphomyces granulatus]|uniref:Probable aspartic-type endopeptidase OPSB n=1 Tax=Elaphomyces granulatus TaxID=519963 RepID=A0A232LUT6_9EURO|nr:hypothetical protein Egran_04354 [Elaphomyces granulatus]
MRASLLLLASLLLRSVDALSLSARDVPAVMTLDVRRRHILDPVSRDRWRRKRSKTVSQTLDNEDTLYFCNITLGTPEQQLRLAIDTGSSDLWCNAANSLLCRHRNLCSASGAYDANSSSTYNFLSSDFNISYVDGTGATGDYVTDTITIGGTTLKNFQFGVGYTSTSAEGVLGIGYPSNEAQIVVNGDAAYANLPKAMEDGGFINSNAYSLWLNDVEANTGTILFGGVDTEQYHDQLQTLPIQRVDGEYSEFIIALTGLSRTSGSSSSYTYGPLPIAVSLDSGSSLSYLPDSLVNSIYDDLQVSYDTSTGTPYVPCSMMDSDVNLTFTFSSPSIPVSMNELVLGSSSWHSEACVFGIAPAGDSTAVLGDTFLRSAYVVYDLANNEISLAKTNFNATTHNILEIGSGSGAVPNATPVSNPVTTVAVGGGGARIGGPSETGSFTGTPKSAAAAIKPPKFFERLIIGIAGVELLLIFCT